MNTFLIRRRGGWSTPRELEKAASRASRVSLHEMADRVRWIRSYITTEPDGSLGTVCIFQGTTAHAVREHARRAGIPADEVVPVGNTIVFNDDPPASR
jgi:hypothetical protein